jgi:hypothetical protein
MKRQVCLHFANRPLNIIFFVNLCALFFASKRNLTIDDLQNANKHCWLCVAPAQYLHKKSIITKPTIKYDKV